MSILYIGRNNLYQLHSKLKEKKTIFVFPIFLISYVSTDMKAALFVTGFLLAFDLAADQTKTIINNWPNNRGNQIANCK